MPQLLACTASGALCFDFYGDKHMHEREALLQRIMDIGELMMRSGAEINRVEDTLRRIGEAYGAHMDVYAIIFSIVITMRYPDGEVITQTRRVGDRDDIDFVRLDQLNALSRRCCAHPMKPDELEQEIRKAGNIRGSLAETIAGNMLGAGSFSVFFGGSLADGIAAALLSLIVVAVQRTMGRFSSNRILFTFAISAVVGIAIGVCCGLLKDLNRAMVMIGDIMLLNPGVTMINAVREMMVGNTISGQLRLIESVSWALAMAAGFMIAMHLV